MNKKLNVSGIVNELRGASSFFPRPAPIDPLPSLTQTEIHPTVAERQNYRTVELQNGRVTVLPNYRTTERESNRSTELPNGSDKTTYRANRSTVRYSFQFFPEQITALKRLQAHKQLAGESVSLSDLMRGAVDKLLADFQEPTPEK